MGQCLPIQSERLLLCESLHVTPGQVRDVHERIHLAREGSGGCGHNASLHLGELSAQALYPRDAMRAGLVHQVPLAVHLRLRQHAEPSIIIEHVQRVVQVSVGLRQLALERTRAVRNAGLRPRDTSINFSLSAFLSSATHIPINRRPHTLL